MYAIRSYYERLHHLTGSIGNHLIVDLGAFATTGDDPLVLEKSQMLRDCRLGQFQTLPDFLDVATLRHQTGNDFKAHGMAHDLKNFRLPVETFRFDKFSFV